MTKHGVTHCWERLGYTEPPDPPETFHVSKYETANKPPAYGAYKTEKPVDKTSE